jgi:anti-anti-sigma regulatory factor
MEVSENRAGGATILRIVGRVDSSVSKLLEERVQVVIARDENIVVDLAGMT